MLRFGIYLLVAKTLNLNKWYNVLLFSFFDFSKTTKEIKDEFFGNFNHLVHKDVSQVFIGQCNGCGDTFLYPSPETFIVVVRFIRKYELAYRVEKIKDNMCAGVLLVTGTAKNLLLEKSQLVCGVCLVGQHRDQTSDNQNCLVKLSLTDQCLTL